MSLPVGVFVVLELDVTFQPGRELRDDFGVFSDVCEISDLLLAVGMVAWPRRSAKFVFVQRCRSAFEVGGTFLKRIGSITLEGVHLLEQTGDEIGVVVR